jgi:hypothetical protein
MTSSYPPASINPRRKAIQNLDAGTLLQIKLRISPSVRFATRNAKTQNPPRITRRERGEGSLMTLFKKMIS